MLVNPGAIASDLGPILGKSNQVTPAPYTWPCGVLGKTALPQQSPASYYRPLIGLLEPPACVVAIVSECNQQQRYQGSTTDGPTFVCSKCGPCPSTSRRHFLKLLFTHWLTIINALRCQCSAQRRARGRCFQVLISSPEHDMCCLRYTYAVKARLSCLDLKLCSYPTCTQPHLCFACRFIRPTRLSQRSQCSGSQCYSLVSSRVWLSGVGGLVLLAVWLAHVYVSSNLAAGTKSVLAA